MDITQSVVPFITSVLAQLPYILCLAVAALFAVVKWSKHPFQAKIVIAITVILFCDLVFGQIFYAFVLPRLYGSLDGDMIGFFTGSISFLRSIVGGCAILGLSWAAFSRRDATS